MSRDILISVPTNRDHRNTSTNIILCGHPFVKLISLLNMCLIYNLCCCFIFNLRYDKTLCSFKCNNLKNYRKLFKHKFNKFTQDNYINTFKVLMEHVQCENNKKRKVENYLFGSTCYAGSSPRYYDEDKPGYRMIPRPYKHYKPWSIVCKILKEEQFQDLIKVCELEVMTFLYQSLIYYTKNKGNIVYTILYNSYGLFIQSMYIYLARLI